MISISTDSAKLILRILNRIDESLDDCGSYHKVEPDDFRLRLSPEEYDVFQSARMAICADLYAQGGSDD